MDNAATQTAPAHLVAAFHLIPDDASNYTDTVPCAHFRGWYDGEGAVAFPRVIAKSDWWIASVDGLMSLVWVEGDVVLRIHESLEAVEAWVKRTCAA